MPPEAGQPGPSPSEKAGQDNVNAETVHRQMRIDYHYSERDSTSTILDGLSSLVRAIQDPSIDTTGILQKATDFVHDTLWLRQVVIGIKCSDGKFRYRTMAGATPTAWEAHKKLEYTEDEFFDSSRYKARKISDYTNLYLSEDHPFTNDEQGSFNRPLLLSLKRESLTQYIEGDYLDVLILDGRGKLAAWIEVTGTTDGKLPSVASIRCIELVGSILGMVVSMRNGWEHRQS